MVIKIPRTSRHHGATGKTPQPTLAVGTLTNLGPIIAVRRKKKYARRYLIALPGMNTGMWWRRDQFTIRGTP